MFSHQCSGLDAKFSGLQDSTLTLRCHLNSPPAFSLFIDVAKLDKAVSNHLGLDSANDNSETRVTVCPYEGIWEAVKEAANNGARIWV